MALLKKKIKAATLIETIVSMLIITLTFSVSIMVFVNITRTEKDNQKLKCICLLKEIANETKQNKRLLDEEYEYDNFLIRKRIQPYDKSDKLSVLLIEAFDKKENKITTYKELIIYGK